METRLFRLGIKGKFVAIIVIASLLLIALTFSFGTGAVAIAPLEVLAILFKALNYDMGVPFTKQQEAVFWAIRTPRVLSGALVGAVLANSGVAIQGLYRNPLADPGLLGISSGAMLLAALSIVLEINWLGIYTLPLFAFLGSLTIMALIYLIAHQKGRAEVTTLILAGVAITALCESATGFMTYISTDEQLRAISYWRMGSFGGSSWQSLGAVFPFAALAILLLPLFGSSLNALSLGEVNARYLGISVESIKIGLVVLVALSVGAGVSVSGMIGFVGLVAPHVLRLCFGPDHRFLFKIAPFFGALLIVIADLVARTVVSPSELPIGILTAFFGAPFFLYLLTRKRKEIRYE